MTDQTAVQHHQRLVTRVEVIDHIAGVFDNRSASRAELVAAAHASGARLELIDLLHRLPDRCFHRPNEIWTELPEVPVEH